MQTLKRVGAAAAALVMAIAAFGFRLPTLPSLSNDHYLYMAWAQQLLSGDLPGRDFVDPGMPLAYSLSAAVQYAWPGPFSEAVLSIGMLGIAAAFTCLVVADISGSIVGGIAAALFQIALQPRLYSYPKVLVPVVALWLLHQYVTRPGRGWVIAMALWTATGALLRYDLGLYAATGLVLGVAIAHWGDLKRMAATAGSYIVALAAAATPYALLVQLRHGIPAHLHETLEYTKNEEHALDFPWPAFEALQPGATGALTVADSVTFLFYAAYALAIVPVLLLLATYKRQRRETVAVVVALSVMLAAYLLVVLRYPIDTRIQDLSGVLTVAGGWTVVELCRIARVSIAAGGPLRLAAAATATVLAVVLTAASAASVSVLGKVGEQFRETRVMDGMSKVQERVAFIRESGTVWPWDRFWPAGPLPDAVRYLNACTDPRDHILLTWSAPEYFYFSRRAFASGHAIPLAPRAFTSEDDQRRMVSRVASERVPLALINDTRAEQFAIAYPLLDRYVRDHYTPAGHFTVRDGSEITIAVRKDVAVTGRFGEAGWPCVTSAAGRG